MTRDQEHEPTIVVLKRYALADSDQAFRSRRNAYLAAMGRTGGGR